MEFVDFHEFFLLLSQFITEELDMIDMEAFMNCKGIVILHLCKIHYF